MREMCSYEIIEYMNKEEKIAIVGAGSIGINFYAVLQNKNIYPVFFMDNDVKKMGHELFGIPIISPSQIDKCLYIICIRGMQHQTVLYRQLLSLGIKEDAIVILQRKDRPYEYVSNMTEIEQKTEAKKMYYEWFLKEINWDNPQTYNEKLNWEKFFERDERKTKLADKYLVRDWIKEKIGEEYLTRIYGVWDNASDVDFASLPENFVLKLNNGSSRNIIVTDKSMIDEKEIRSQLEFWKNRNHYYVSFEYQYKNIVPKIICEEYLEGVAESLYDYDVYCFHGEPKYIWCINGSHREWCRAAFYDLDWNKQPFSYGYPMDEDVAPRPKNLEKMIELSRILSKDFKHARVDWYQYPKSKHGILFSEITFTTWSGLRNFIPLEYDKIWGDMI